MYRENTKEIAIGNVKIGGTHPVTIQSMTNTKTENVKEISRSDTAFGGGRM